MINYDDFYLKIAHFYGIINTFYEKKKILEKMHFNKIQNFCFSLLNSAHRNAIVLLLYLLYKFSQVPRYKVKQKRTLYPIIPITIQLTISIRLGMQNWANMLLMILNS